MRSFNGLTGDVLSSGFPWLMKYIPKHTYLIDFKIISIATLSLTGPNKMDISIYANQDTDGSIMLFSREGEPIGQVGFRVETMAWRFPRLMRLLRRPEKFEREVFFFETVAEAIERFGPKSLEIAYIIQFDRGCLTIHKLPNSTTNFSDWINLKYEEEKKKIESFLEINVK